MSDALNKVASGDLDSLPESWMDFKLATVQVGVASFVLKAQDDMTSSLIDILV